jgi:hypothetical protein
MQGRRLTRAESMNDRTMTVCCHRVTEKQNRHAAPAPRGGLMQGRSSKRAKSMNGAVFVL